MKLPLTSYKTLIFDCDGVILNSNSIKTDCFYSAVSTWSKEAASDLVAYHLQNGGVSRHIKFKYFYDSILPLYFPDAVPGVDGPGFQDVLQSYSNSVYHALLNCDIADRLEDLRSLTPSSSWCVVSGGDQDELRQLFATRHLNHLFDAGIFGSPDPKSKILTREISKGTIQFPALFLGDSKYDYYSSFNSNIDFLFLYGWTDVLDWSGFVSEVGASYIKSLADLIY